ncbi:MAG: hypothetical protein ACI85O_001869 [Saprospiraceae bacterium]|jgi:hypothetical protein
MKANTATDTKKVFQTIDDTFAELKQGIDPKKLSETDKSELLEELDKLEALVLEIKRGE